MTVEKASELVKNARTEDKPDLFSHFEQLLNPHPPKINGVWNDASADWQEMFAIMCGFGIAKNAIVL